MKNKEPVGLLNNPDAPFLKIIYPFVVVLDWLAKKPHFNVLIWFVLSTLLYGIGSTSNYFYISENPFTTDPRETIFQDSILLPVISYYLRLNQNFQLFLIFCFFILLAAFVLYAYLPRKEYGIYGGALSLLVLAFHPMTAVQFNVLGLVDGITILLSSLLIYSSSPILLLLASLLGVTNHPVMMIIGPGIALLRFSAAKHGFRKIEFQSILFGTAIGFLVVKIFLHVNKIIIPITRFNLIFEVGIKNWLRMRISELPLNLFTLYGGLLLIILICIYYGYKEKPLFYLIFMGLQVVAFLIVIFTLDPTRLFGLITLPSVLLCILFTLEKSKSNSIDYAYLASIFFIIFVTTVFVPKYFAWDGRIWLYKSATMISDYLLP